MKIVAKQSVDILTGPFDPSKSHVTIKVYADEDGDKGLWGPTKKNDIQWREGERVFVKVYFSNKTIFNVPKIQNF